MPYNSQLALVSKACRPLSVGGLPTIRPMILPPTRPSRRQMHAHLRVSQCRSGETSCNKTSGLHRSEYIPWSVTSVSQTRSKASFQRRALGINRDPSLHTTIWGVSRFQRETMISFRRHLSQRTQQALSLVYSGRWALTLCECWYRACAR